MFYFLVSSVFSLCPPFVLLFWVASVCVRTPYLYAILGTSECTLEEVSVRYLLGGVFNADVQIVLFVLHVGATVFISPKSPMSLPSREIAKICA